MNMPMTNRPSQARSMRTRITPNIDTFYAVKACVNKCGWIFNIIDETCVWVCVSDKVKSMNIKVFNFMSRVNEARFLVQHESCKCNCRLTESGCNSK